MASTPSGSLLASVERVFLTPSALNETGEFLRECGAAGCEGFALWVGTVRDRCAQVAQVLIPSQQLIRSEEGVGYFVDASSLFEVNCYLAQTRRRLIAQVHSHPREAYHSATDDRYAVVTTEGGFSIVVPDFARAPVTPYGSAVFRLSRGRWHRLDMAEMRELFVIRP